MKLEPDFVKELEAILESGKTAEIAVRNGKIVMWAVASKKKREQPIV